MKVAVIGSGGREHAIVRRLKESRFVTKLYALPGNGGIASDAECVDIRATDLDGIVAFAVREELDYVVVAPDDPLAMGLVDRLAEAGIPAFGPCAKAAMIESSKVFSKGLMKKYGIPTADYRVFDSAEAAREEILKTERWPVVLKADGLALGKGVLICENLGDALEALDTLMLKKKFGAAGDRIVMEEFLTGPEVSVLAFTDGKTMSPMVSSMDHKRAQDGDQGLNTGGMGTVAPNPYYTKEIADRCMKEIFLPTMAAMNAEGRTFRGCLYFGLMLTPDGPKVIEYNCRFGDPETQVVLPLLKGDLFRIMLAVTAGRLAEVPVESDPGAAACVVLASGGYPLAYKKGLPIEGLAGGQLPGADRVTVYHAGTKLENGKLVTAGGRVLGVTATAADLPAALKTAYAAVGRIRFDGMFFRHDIGARALRANR